MRRRKIVVAAAAALILLAGGWYWGWPWWTLWRMREAARAGDLRALAAYVDYATIRERIRADWRAAAASIRSEVRSDTPGGRQFIAYVQRQAALPDPPLAAAMAEIRPWIAGIPIRLLPFGGAPARHSYRPVLVRYGLDRFEVRHEGADWEMGPVLAFRRRGLGWRLVDVRWGQQ